MKTITIADIRSWEPCYDPSRHLPEDWSGTALDLVTNEKIPWEDVLWCVARESVVDDGLLRRFSAWCAAEALFVAKQTDARSWNAVEVAVKFSLGQSTKSEMAAAGAAAWDAAGAAAWDAAGVAAGAAARVAAGVAARVAARVAAGAAAWDAQRAKLAAMLKGESDFTLSNLLNDYPIGRT